MQRGHYDFDGRTILLGVIVDRNAAPVVGHADDGIFVNDDFDLRAETSERLVDCVVDNLIDEMVRTVDVGAADVHRRALAHGLQAFENLDLLGGVFLRHRRLSLVILRTEPDTV